MARVDLAVFILATNLVAILRASPTRWTDPREQNIAREKRQLKTCPGFPGFCSESFPGSTCLVICSFGRNNVPQCQEDGTWTDIPRCIEHEPGIPQQTPGVCPGIPGYCSQDFPGGLCQFDCTAGPDIRSTCTKDGTWEPYPTCQGDIRETRDGCSHCPGPNGGPRNRSTQHGKTHKEQPRNIEVSQQGKLEQSFGGSPQGSSPSRKENTRQDWRTASRKQQRHQVEWEKDQIRFVNPDQYKKLNNVGRPIWNQGQDQLVHKSRSQFGIQEISRINDNFPSSFPTVRSKKLENPSLIQSVGDFPTVSNPFEQFPSFFSKTTETIPQFRVNNQNTHQNNPELRNSADDFTHLSRPFEGFTFLPSETTETNSQFPANNRNAPQNIPRFSDQVVEFPTLGEPFKTFPSPSRELAERVSKGNINVPQSEDTNFEKIPLNAESKSDKQPDVRKQDIPTLKKVQDQSFRSIFSLPPAKEVKTEQPRFSASLFGLPIGDDLPSTTPTHQTSVIKNEKQLDLSHDKQINYPQLEKKTETFQRSRDENINVLTIKENRQQVNGNIQDLVDAKNNNETVPKQKTIFPINNGERVTDEIHRGRESVGTNGPNPSQFNGAPRFHPGRRRNGPRRRPLGRKRSQRRRPHIRRNQNDRNLVDSSQHNRFHLQKNWDHEQLQRDDNQGQLKTGRKQDQTVSEERRHQSDNDRDKFNGEKYQDDSVILIHLGTSEKAGNDVIGCPREQLLACVDICPGFNHIVYGACVAGCSKRCNRN